MITCFIDSIYTIITNLTRTVQELLVIGKVRGVINDIKTVSIILLPIPGRAEASRVALSLSNLDWEDVALTGEMFASMKNNGELPWGMVPFLKTPHGGLAESVAILRYLGHMWLSS